MLFLRVYYSCNILRLVFFIDVDFFDWIKVNSVNFKLKSNGSQVEKDDVFEVFCSGQPYLIDSAGK